MFKILLDFGPDTNYKQNKFYKTLLKEDFKFISTKKDSNIAFNLSFI